MPRPLVILAVFLFFIQVQGCTAMNMSNPFPSDPMTGGMDRGTSQLLGIPIPVGMQCFPSHGYQNGAQGLEIFRGRVAMDFVAQVMFSGMQGQGFNLLMAQNKGSRAVYLYERGATLAALVVERETLGTVLTIWVAERMPPGSTLPVQENRGASAYGGSGFGTDGGINTTPVPGTTETWGGKNGGVQERDL